MKKFVLLLFAVLIFTPSVHAATITSLYLNQISQHETKVIAPVTVTAAADLEITAEHGINILLDTGREILWDDVSSLTVTGTAVDSGKIGNAVTPEYRNSYKVVHIPVTADFESDESAQITGLAMRAYNKSFDNRFLGLDVTGDYVADATDINAYRVTSDTNTDHTPPYPADNFAYSVAENHNSVMLTWGNPPDYDVINFMLKRVLTRGSVTSPTEILFEVLFTDFYTDNDVQPGDSIVYSLYARDSRNIGQEAQLTVVVEEEQEQEEQEQEQAEEEQEQAEEEQEEGTAPADDSDTDDETADLDRLFNYYKIRYNIKCRPGGVPAPESSSTCLWARIDLVYAQEKLDRPDELSGVVLSDCDKELMAKRRKYPEARYQTYCTEAAEAASYCPALGKALDRISYFLD